jgi:hypothetical protein
MGVLYCTLSPGLKKDFFGQEYTNIIRRKRVWGPERNLAHGFTEAF